MCEVCQMEVESMSFVIRSLQRLPEESSWRIMAVHCYFYYYEAHRTARPCSVIVIYPKPSVIRKVYLIQYIA